MAKANDDDITPPHILDEARYLALMRELAEQRSAYDEADNNPLLVAYYQLGSVLQFFFNDPGVQYNSLTLPLERLLASIHDTLRGAQSPLLHNVNRSPGAPTNMFRDALRGAVVGALDNLIAAGMRPTEAAGWLVKEANRHRIKTPNGERLTVKQLLAWRSLGSRGKVPASQAAAHKGIRALAKQVTVESAQLYARDVLAVVAEYDFVKTPPVFARK